MAQSGFPEGTRNNSLFMIGLYLKRKHETHWKDLLEQHNRDHMRPPLASDEVQVAIKSLEKRDYEYTCRTEPMCSHCDAAVCRGRRFGVGDPRIEGINRVDYAEPEYHVTTPFGRVSVSMHALYRFVYFNEECGQQTGRLFTMPPKKHADWLAIVDAAMREVVVIDPPPDLRPGAEFREVLEDFLVNRTRGRRREDILAGRPWEDEDEKRHWFRLRDLVDFMVRSGHRNVKRNGIADELRKLGGESGPLDIKGEKTWCWRVPSDVVQPTPELPLPEMRKQVI